MMMEAACSSETLAHGKNTTHCNIPEDRYSIHIAVKTSSRSHTFLCLLILKEFWSVLRLGIYFEHFGPWVPLMHVLCASALLMCSSVHFRCVLLL
jgi:hypothetical protein